MAIGINSRHTKEEHREKPDHTFPEPHHTKHQPHGAPSNSSEHWTRSSESVGRGHEDSMNRLNEFGGFPENEPHGSGAGSGEGVDGKGHALGQRSPWDE